LYHQNHKAMISEFRMKIDTLGQAILIVAVVLIACFYQNTLVPTKWLLSILTVWQLASAIHLLLVYQHIKRLNYIKTAIVLLVSLPIWKMMVGNWAYLALVGVVLWYFFLTIKDTRAVINHPKSFWDLG
jgi:multisubunit Na+/H+ antiporter MnhG subunit